MFRKLSILLTYLFCAALPVMAQKTPTNISLGIVNGMAVNLPKPVFPQEAKDFCAGGKVSIEVNIAEDGRVLDAKAIAGDELLYETSIAAAKNTTFRLVADGPPVKTRGVLIYNFEKPTKCFDAGIVNKRAIELPKPIIPNDAMIDPTFEAKVRVIIDETGKVIFAKAVTQLGPILRAAFESAARKALFHPTNDVGKVRFKGYIVYKVNRNREVELSDHFRCL